MKQCNRLPDICGAIFIIDVLVGPEIIIGAVFYDADIVFFRGDPGGIVYQRAGQRDILSILMHIPGMKYRDLFHPSRHSMSGTLSQQRMGNTDSG